ncbi:hypothetical protein Efla_006756 [Eimeria flavescens]
MAFLRQSPWLWLLLGCLYLSASTRPAKGEWHRRKFHRRSSSSSSSSPGLLMPDLSAPLAAAEGLERPSLLQTDEEETPQDSSMDSSSSGSNPSSTPSSSRNILEIASSLNGQQYEASASPSAGPEQPEEPADLTELIVRTRECRVGANPILVIDGGSTGTRGALFRVEAESCPLRGRRVLAEGIRLLQEGRKFQGLRQLLEDWLDAHAGADWPSKPYDAAALLKQYPSMVEVARQLMHAVLDDAALLIRKYFTEEEQQEAVSLGVPVLFYSTAGIRDTHDWFRRGLFAAFLQAINTYSSDSHPFEFFSNEEWTRPISGVEEGLLAFVAANQLLGNFRQLQQARGALEAANPLTPERKLLQERMQQRLLSIVEVGGASMQVVFPVFTLGSSPSFVRTTNLVRSAYLPDEYPSLDVLSTSYMQLGASSATGIFYKSFCGTEANLRDGVCLNPCLPRGYKQQCSTGEVTIGPQGEVQVAPEIRKQRLKPVAYYCTSSNAEIAKKTLNRLSCLAAGIDPEEPLGQRLTIRGCREMEGTGDFAACSAAVFQTLLDPALPLPANQEASYTGFDTVGQIFEFISTNSPVVITGKALVMPIQDLQRLGLLQTDFKGNPEQLATAATRFCSAPVVKREKGLFRSFAAADSKQEEGEKTEAPLDSLNVESCFKLAFGQGLLRLLNKSQQMHPSNVSFALSIKDPQTGDSVGEFGWPPGAILRAVLHKRTWARYAYELGKHHAVRERWRARRQSQQQQQQQQQQPQQQQQQLQQQQQQQQPQQQQQQ